MRKASTSNNRAKNRRHPWRAAALAAVEAKKASAPYRGVAGERQIVAPSARMGVRIR